MQDITRMYLHMEKCAGIVGTLSQLWENGTDAERSEMIHDLFDEIVVNVDTRRITSFKLKPWVDQFLTVRASLYEVENQKTPPEIGAGSEFIGSDTAMPPRGSSPYPTLFQISFCIRHVKCADWHLASGEIASERNQTILEKYDAGYTLMQLAQMFHISYQRAHQIIRCAHIGDSL